MKITVPVWSSEAPASDDGAAPRWPASFAGKKLGLLHNTKVNGDELLEAFAEALGRENDGMTVVRACKPYSSMGMTESDLAALRGCDGVLIAVGD